VAAPGAPIAAPARRDTGILAAVVAVTALVFLSGVTGNFVSWDDDINFTNNEHFRGLGWAQIQWAFTTFHLGVYQPLAWLTLELQFVVGGLSPVIYHLVSWLLHALNAALVYRLLIALLRRSSGDTFDPGRTAWPAAAGALLWALHPLRAEAVAWASCQPYLLATMFALLATLAYLRVAERGRSRRWWLATLGLYLAAVLSKAEAIPLPLAWLVLDVYPLQRVGGTAGWFGGPRVRRVWAEKLPFLAVAAGAAVAAVAARAQEHQLASLEMTGVGPRLAHAAPAVWLYLGKTLAPWTLSPYYPRPPELARGLAAPLYAGAASAAIAVTLLLIRFARRVPALCAAWIAYLVFLLPHAGLVRIGNQLGADRYTYLSSIGFAAAIAGGLSWLARGGATQARRRALVGSVAAAALVLAVLAARQTDVWDDSESLWSFTYERSGAASGHVANNWGAVLIGQRRFAEAVEVLSRAVKLSPRNGKAFHNLGIALSQTGADVAAATALAEAARLRGQAAVQ
jgi:protein O-mannosyl-transferase